ncbi:hypothetical protein G5714_021692 [Onychostoma macrolepis]|uniref:Uncharacterized protein n=1 Tax=Onychostoma macrolepis TaxID=369639 RepID=A0A7J6BS24_9TELE|nr:hypothetical protein G5714_021692 [Onychostoma macrolepis]
MGRPLVLTAWFGATGQGGLKPKLNGVLITLRRITESAYEPYWPSAPADQRTEGGIWPRGPMKPLTRAQYSVVGRVGPIGLADKKSLGRPTRRLSRHPTGDQDSRHRMDEPHLRAASTSALRETSVNV